MKSMRKPAISPASVPGHLMTVVIILGVSGIAHGAGARIFYSDNVPRFAVWERSVSNSGRYSNPFDFNEIELKGEFTAPSGEKTGFFGFFDGDGKGGQDGDVWKIRFMPTEAGLYRYTLSFSDGRAIGDNSGSFTVVASDLPGPPELMGETPPASYFLKDARGNPIKWKSYSLAFTAWKDNNGGHDFYEKATADFMKSMIDKHMVPQGYNATMLESPINSATGPVGLMHEDGKSFHLGCAKNMDAIVAKLAEEKIWAVNWTAYTTQPGYALTGKNTWDNLYNNRRLLMRYFVARWAPFYNYFGWSPTWETMELKDDKGRTEAIQKLVIEYSPWEKFPTTHDATRSAWSDWQRIQLRQHQSRNIDDGNTRTDVRDSWKDYKYVVIAGEDTWEQCKPKYKHPRNGTEVRHAVWGELLAGVYPMYSEWRHGGKDKGPCDGNGKGEGDTFNKIAADIWYDNTRWYTYSMKNSLVNDAANCRCSGKDNAEYFVYDQNGGSNSIDLSGVDGSYALTWFNPLTGDSTSGGTVDGGKPVALSPPGAMSSEWAVLLRKQNATRNDRSVSRSVADRPLVHLHGADMRIRFSIAENPMHITVFQPNGAVVFHTHIRMAGGAGRILLPQAPPGMHLVRLSGSGTHYWRKSTVPVVPPAHK